MQVSLQNDGPVTLEIESPSNIGIDKAKNKSQQSITNDRENYES